MLSPPVINPPVPFVGPIPGGLHDGKIITLHGHVPSNASRFAVDFCKPTKSDIPFHINIRYDENCVVRNSLLNDSWGAEEREPPYVPMQRGHSFEMMILVEPSSYKVAVNGRHFIEYAHRDPYSLVTTLAIEGSVFISKIEYRENVKFPVPSFGYVPTPTLQICPRGPVSAIPLGGHKYQPVYNPALPFVYPIYGGLQVGTNIYISGRPTLRPHRFSINLQCGSLESSDIAFHFNPRFDSVSVVRNSKINDKWGTEERHGQFFFENGITFDMYIHVQQNCFSVVLNGLPFISYNHRILPISRVNTLEIEGDVHISCVQFK